MQTRSSTTKFRQDPITAILCNGLLVAICLRTLGGLKCGGTANFLLIAIQIEHWTSRTTQKKKKKKKTVEGFEAPSLGPSAERASLPLAALVTIDW